MGAAAAGLTVTLFAIRLGANPLQLGLIGMIWPSVYTVSCLFSGPLADRMPGRRLPLIGSVTACLSYVLLTRCTTPFHVMLLGLPVGVSLSLFWPPLEAWIAHLSSPTGLRRNFGVFNIAWSLGAAPGPLMAGLALGVDLVLSIAISVLFVALAGIVVATQSGNCAGSMESRVLSEDETLSRRFLHVAWVANFATYFTIGIIRSLFPKLGGQLGMGSTAIGALLSIITFAQVSAFALLRQTARWHYRLAPMVLSLSILLGVSLLIYTSTSFVQFIPAMALMGTCTGVAYFSSLYYSLNTPTERGARSGIHEALIGLGVVAGPLSGGIVAQVWGLRAPYILSAGVTLFVIFTTAIMGLRIPKKQAQPSEDVVQRRYKPVKPP